MRKIQLSIPEPCHEDWNKMSISQQGRYCQSCKKEVIDFSHMPDDKILKMLAYSVNICGRVEEDQLGRNLSAGGRNNFLFKHAWKFLLPTFFFSKGVSAQGKVARVDTKRVIIPEVSNRADRPQMVGMMLRAITVEKKYTINGNVSDSTTGELIPNARIIISGKGVDADEQGNFNITSKTINSIITIEVSASGYEKKLIPISIPVNGFKIQVYTKLIPSFKILKPVIIDSQVLPRRLYMGDMSIVNTIVKKDSITKIDAITTRDPIINNPQNQKDSFLNRIQNLLSPNYLKVFPNPVSSGGSFNLSIQLFKPGNYSLQLVDINGRVMLTKQLNVSSIKVTESVTCEASIVAGNYIITISDSNNKIIQSGKLVVL